MKKKINAKISKLNRELARALKMKGQATETTFYYWKGYIEGLNRLLFGAVLPNGVTNKKHFANLDLEISSDIFKEKQFSAGYKEGFKFEIHSAPNGRPKKFDLKLQQLSIKKKMANDLQQIASNQNRTLPEIRREAYNEYIEKCLKKGD